MIYTYIYVYIYTHIHTYYVYIYIYINKYTSCVYIYIYIMCIYIYIVITMYLIVSTIKPGKLGATMKNIFDATQNEVDLVSVLAAWMFHIFEVRQFGISMGKWCIQTLGSTIYPQKSHWENTMYTIKSLGNTIFPPIKSNKLRVLRNLRRDEASISGCPGAF